MGLLPGIYQSRDYYQANQEGSKGGAEIQMCLPAAQNPDGADIS